LQFGYGGFCFFKALVEYSKEHETVIEVIPSFSAEVYWFDPMPYLRLAQLTGVTDPEGYVRYEDLKRVLRYMAIEGKPVEICLHFKDQTIRVKNDNPWYPTDYGYTTICLNVTNAHENGFSKHVELWRDGDVSDAMFEHHEDLEFGAKQNQQAKSNPKQKQQPNKRKTDKHSAYNHMKAGDHKPNPKKPKQENAQSQPQTPKEREYKGIPSLLQPCELSWNGESCKHIRLRTRRGLTICQSQLENPKQRIGDPYPSNADVREHELSNSCPFTEIEEVDYGCKCVHCAKKNAPPPPEEKKSEDEKILNAIRKSKKLEGNLIVSTINSALERVGGAYPKNAIHASTLLLRKAMKRVTVEPSRAQLYCAARHYLMKSINLVCCKHEMGQHPPLCTDPTLMREASKFAKPYNEYNQRQVTTELVRPLDHEPCIDVRFKNTKIHLIVLACFLLTILAAVLFHIFGQIWRTIGFMLVIVQYLGQCTYALRYRTSTDATFLQNVAEQQEIYDRLIEENPPTSIQSVNERKSVELLHLARMHAVDVVSQNYVQHLAPQLLKFWHFVGAIGFWILTSHFLSSLCCLIVPFVTGKIRRQEIVSLELLDAMNSGSVKTVANTLLDFQVSVNALIRNYTDIVDPTRMALLRKQCANLADGTKRVAMALFVAQNQINIENEKDLNGMGGILGSSLVLKGTGLMSYLHYITPSSLVPSSYLTVAAASIPFLILTEDAPNLTTILLVSLLYLLSSLMFVIPALTSLIQFVPYLERRIDFSGVRRWLSRKGDSSDLSDSGSDAISTEAQSARTFSIFTSGCWQPITRFLRKPSSPDYTSSHLLDSICDDEASFQSSVPKIPTKKLSRNSWTGHRSERKPLLTSRDEISSDSSEDMFTLEEFREHQTAMLAQNGLRLTPNSDEQSDSSEEDVLSTSMFILSSSSSNTHNTNVLAQSTDA